MSTLEGADASSLNCAMAEDGRKDRKVNVATMPHPTLIDMRCRIVCDSFIMYFYQFLSKERWCLLWFIFCLVCCSAWRV